MSTVKTTHIHVYTHTQNKQENDAKKRKEKEEKLWIRTKPPMLGAIRTHCFCFVPSHDAPCCSFCHMAGKNFFDRDIFFKCWEVLQWECNSEICECGTYRVSYHMFLFSPPLSSPYRRHYRMRRSVLIAKIQTHICTYMYTYICTHDIYIHTHTIYVIVL